MSTSKTNRISLGQKEEARALGQLQFRTLVAMEIAFAPFKRYSVDEQLEMMKYSEVLGRAETQVRSEPHLSF